MTEVAFHFNVPDKMNYVCRILRKASQAKARVVVSGPPKELQTLDEALWTFSPHSFIAHCWSTDDITKTQFLITLRRNIIKEALSPARNLGVVVPHDKVSHSAVGNGVPHRQSCHGLRNLNCGPVTGSCASRERPEIHHSILVGGGRGFLVRTNCQYIAGPDPRIIERGIGAIKCRGSSHGVSVDDRH